MRGGWLALGCVVAVLAASAAGVGEAAVGDVRKLGRYEIETLDSGVEIWTGPGSGFGRLLGAGGVLGLVAGLVLASRPRTRPPAMVVIPVGLALLVAAAVARMDDLHWRLGPRGVEREDVFGRVARFPPESIAAVELRPRQLSRPELKQFRGEPRWIVGVRGTDGALVARFLFASRQDAMSLATDLAGLTRRPLREHQAPARRE